MKNLVFFLLLLPLINFAQDFKTYKWGDLISVIKKNETSKLISAGKDTLIYESKVLNIDSKLTYFFKGGKLEAIEYDFVKVSTDKNYDLDSLNVIRKLLVEKYGKPTKIQNFMIPTSILEWEMPRTYIYFWIEKYKGLTHHSITYRNNIKKTTEKKEELNKL
jgi:hypothetical protein